MSELLLSFAANPKAGKSTCIPHVSERYNLPVVSGSAVLREWAHERGVELNVRADYTVFHKRIRHELGLTCLMDAVLEQRNTNGVIFDGLRTLPDLARSKEAGGITFSLWCPFDIRLGRSIVQADIKDAVAADKFAEAERAEYNDPDIHGQHTLQVMQMTDFAIDTTQPIDVSLETIYHHLDKIVA